MTNNHFTLKDYMCGECVSVFRVNEHSWRHYASVRTNEDDERLMMKMVCVANVTARINKFDSNKHKC